MSLTTSHAWNLYCRTNPQDCDAPGSKGGIPSAGSYLDDLVLYGVANQFANGVQFEPAHDVGAMGFGCLDAYVESDSHFLARFAFGKKLDDFALAPGQATASVAVRLARSVAAEAVHHHFGNLGGEKRAMQTDGFDGAHQIAITVGLQNVAANPRVDDFVG
jgi:hypothetical protein